MTQTLKAGWQDLDLVHAHWPLPSGALGLVISSVRRKPLVVTSHGAFVEDFESQPWLVRELVRFILRRADVIVAVGQHHGSKVRRIIGRSVTPVRCLDMGVWLQQRLPSQPEARGLLGIAEGEKIVVFIGNLSYRKGVDVLLKAVAKVARCDVSFRVIIGGQGPERANSFQLISQLGLGGIVRFVGPVAPDDVFTWFAAADICAVPSRTETFGLVALEAMACGTPVVAANVGGLSETITHGENGLLFPLEDDAALAAHICELFSNESLRSKLAERGRETAREHDMRLQAEKVGQIYRDLIEHRSGD